MHTQLWKTTLPCLALLFPPLMVQAGVAGRIQFVAGEVQIQAADGKRRSAAKGDEVMESESIITAAHASAQLKMVDGGILALHADTHITLEAYAVNGAGEAEKAWISLLKGGLRSLTGLIGKRRQENYAIRTPNAVIGIRGTDHEPVVILPDTVLAKRPPSGSYDKVNLGMTSLSNAAGTTLISRNQVGFASAANVAPQLLPSMPDFYQVAPTDSKASEPAAASGKYIRKIVIENGLLQAHLAMQGVAALTDPKQALNTAYRAVITADDGSLAWASAAELPPSANANASIHYGSTASRLQIQDGRLEAFIGSASHYTPLHPSAQPLLDQAATIQRGSANNTNLGSARLGNTGVNWGRWENGVINIYSRDGQTRLGSINNAARSIHWLTTSATSGPLATLPQTGSATYTVVGYTQPTDLKGNVGVFGQAKVEIDFSALRANTSLQLDFHAPEHMAHWQMEVKNTPIIRGDIVFNSSSSNHGVNGESHLVQCQGMGCGNSHVGNLSAFFLGQGAPGLGFSYDMVTGDRNDKNQFMPRNNAHGLVILRK